MISVHDTLSQYRMQYLFFFFSSRRRHTRCLSDWSSDVCSSDLVYPQVDRLPLEALVGWDATQNGNMAQLLQEPSLMGALEGAAVTVLSKGMLFPAGTDPFGTGPSAAENGVFPPRPVLASGGPWVGGRSRL